MEKRAVVIGASSGLGREVTLLLLKDGWRVGIGARREERLMQIKREWGEQVEVAQIDVTTEEAVEGLHMLIARLGGMNLYFHASGIGKQNPELTPEVEVSTMHTNATGFTRMVGAAFRYFAQQGHGHIAAITSVAGTKGLGQAPAYSATKALQNTYLQALEQLSNKRQLHIRFTDIRPGFVDTELLSGTHHYPMMLHPEQVAKAIVKAICQQRHIVVIDWRWHLLTMLWRRIPRWLWRRMKI
jgi:short-subunit dehydrogenase